MWRLLQSLIVFAVVGSNIHWEWTPNHYLPAILGFVLALIVTAGFNELRDLRAQRAARKQQVHYRPR